MTSPPEVESGPEADGAILPSAPGLVELIRERDRAVAASRAKDDFIATLSHELRAPLNPVLLLATDCADNPDLPAAARAAFEVIARYALIEARLIDDLLDLTGITHGKLSLELQRIEVKEVLRGVVSAQGRGFAEKNVTLTVELSPAAAIVLGDPVRLQQIFGNVLRNALKFTPAGGSVRLATEGAAGGREVVVTVADSGIGMTAAELERVFDKFFQGDHAKQGGAHRFGGMGLGLAISHLLVEQHAGRFDAHSAGRDLGTTFSIALPLAPAGPVAKHLSSAAWARSAEAVTGPSLAPRRILLVEDHPGTRTSLTALLSRRGHRVAATATVGGALAHAKQERFDLVISDNDLPDGDGCALMLKLQEQYGLPGIALSGYGMEEDIVRSLHSGFALHLTKPATIQDLERAIAAIDLPGK